MRNCVKTLLEQTASQIEDSTARCVAAEESIAGATTTLTISWDVIARSRIILARGSPKLTDFDADPQRNALISVPERAFYGGRRSRPRSARRVGREPETGGAGVS